MKQTSRLYKGILTVLFAMTGLVMSSRALTTVVNDTWSDGTRTDPASPVYSENGVDSDADGSIESAWFRGNSGTMSATPGHLLVNGLAASSSSWTTYFTPQASPVSLVNPGDKIHFVWTFTPSGVNSSNGNQGFSVAMVQSPASPARISTDTTPGSAIYAGYSLFMNMGQVSGNVASFQLRKWSLVTAGALLGTSANWTALTNTVGVGSNGYASGTTYTLDMTITRNASSGNDIVAQVTGGALNGVGSNYLAFTDTAPGTFTYDTFAVRITTAATTATDFDTTLFKVEFIPGCDTVHVTASPTNTSAFQNQPATFNVTATGTTPSYQWQISTDGGSTFSNLVGATSSSFTTNNVPLAASGNQFRCAVSVACDSSTTNSAAATLTVNSCTTAGISSSPTNSTVGAGSTASFSVTGTGSAPTYQWQLSTNSGVNWDNIPSATSSTYTTPTTVTTDNGKQYRAVVSVPCDSSSVTSTVATLTVVCTTVGISNQPANIAVLVGNPAVFSLVASGSLPTYQWQTNNGGGWLSVPGATSSSYTIPVTASTDNGLQARCAVSVACDSSSITSSAATLTIGTVGNTSFRTASSGTWSNASIWQWSFDGGANWFSATAAPSDSNNTNTLVQVGHVVTVNSAVSIDDLTISGQVSISGAAFTIAADGAAVNGKLIVSSTSGSSLVRTGPLTFNSGGEFDWNLAAAPAIPVATWADGSTCRITSGPGSNYSVANVDGQNFYNFVWDFAAQNSTADLGIITTTTVRGDLSITNGKTITLNNTGPTAGTLSVTGNVTVAGSGKVSWVGPTGGTWDENINIGGNLLVVSSGAGLDSVATAAQSHVAFNGSGAQTVNITSAVSGAGRSTWKVNSGSSLKLLGLASSGYASLTVNGSLDLDGVVFTAQVLNGATTGLVTNSGAAVTLTIGANATTTGTYSGVFRDGGNAISLTKGNTNSLTLDGTAANQYSGVTTVSGGGQLTVAKDGGLGGSNVVVSGTSTLVLTNGTSNNYITDTANLNLSAASSVALGFTGSDDTIGTLTISGATQPAGTWGAPGSGASHTNAQFSGTGRLNVASGVPELISSPSAVSTNVGDTVSFTADIIGTPSPTLQWEVSTNSGTNWDNVPGETAATLTFTAQLSQSGDQYRLTATNTLGSVNSAAATLTVSCPTITLGNLPAASGKNANYSHSAAASGGSAPYVYAVGSGALPDGLALDTSSGLVSGISTSDGIFTFTLTATDTNGCVGSSNYTITVSCPVITLGSLPDAPKNGKYNQPLSASGGVASYTFAKTAGTLPPGLALTLTNSLAGKPSTYGSYVFSVTATDTNGCTGSRVYTLLVSSAVPDTTGPKVTITTPKNGAVLTNPPVAVTGVAKDSVQTTNVTYMLDGGATNETIFTVSNAAPWSISLSNLTAGAHTVTVQGTDLSGNLGAPVSVTFNYGTNSFLPLAGVYYGLFSESASNVAYPSAGFAQVTISAKPSKLATFSAKINVAGTKVSGSGTFGMDGKGLLKKPMTQNGQNVTLALTLPFDGSGTLTGSISNAAATPPWNSTLLADLAVVNKVALAGTAYDGTYTLVVPSPTNTIGDGYGYLVIANGQVKLGGGKLANAQNFSQSVYLSAHGDWPLFSKGDTSGGINKSELLGWASVSTNHAITTENLVWINTGGLVTYPGGFTNNVGLKASTYDPNFGSGLVLSLDSNTPVAAGNVTLSGNGLTTNIVNSVSLQNSGGKNKFLDTLGTKTNKQYTLTLSLSAPKGTLTGSFKAPNDGVAKGNIFGVVLQSSNTANGYFLQNPVTPQSGTFLLK